MQSMQFSDDFMQNVSYDLLSSRRLPRSREPDRQFEAVPKHAQTTSQSTTNDATWGFIDVYNSLRPAASERAIRRYSLSRFLTIFGRKTRVYDCLAPSTPRQTSAELRSPYRSAVSSTRVSSS